MRYRSNNIMTLVPPGEDAIPVLRQAMFFQKTLGMQVFLYRVLNQPSLFDKIFHAKKAKQEKIKELQNLRNLAEKIIPADSIKHFTYRIKHGDKLSVLLRQSRKGDYEFIILDKDDTENSLNHEELDRLISRSGSPIMSISNKHHVRHVDHILIPVDISQATQKKLLWATYFAKKYNAKITIVSAVNLNIHLKHSLSWKNAERLKQMLLQRGIECEVTILKVKEKEKHDVILEYIRKINPGLVIIRTHQESNLKDTQIGNFVSSIVHGSKIPVFTVNSFLSPTPIDFEA